MFFAEAAHGRAEGQVCLPDVAVELVLSGDVPEIGLDYDVGRSLSRVSILWLC